MSHLAWARLSAALEDRPEHPLLITDELVLTGADLRARAEQWAARLLARGVVRGDRIAVLAEAHAEAVALMLGIHRAGLVHVPINPRYREAELAHVVEDCGAALFLCDQALADERLQALPPALGRFAIDAGPALAPLPIPTEPIPTEPIPTEPIPTEPIADDETALLIYTSGTTGRSKGVRLSLSAVVGNILALTTLWRFSAADTLSLALPLFHVHGLCIGIYGALLHGLSVRLHPRFDPAAIVADFEHGATIFMGVPTMYDRLLEHLQAHPEASAALRRARLFTAGSAALRPAMLERFEMLTGHRILERYGMTETLITLSNPYEGERRPGAVGMPVPGVEARIVDEQGRILPPGQSGELWVRGPFLMQGYFARPDDTAAAFCGDWFRTGDVVIAEPDGYLRIVGRSSTDIIKSGGFKVAALEIEEVLRQHPAVREVAVVGLPDHRWGERIAAAVVPGTDPPPSAATLVAWVAEHLADYKKPRQLAMLSELPRNALGKVQKHALIRALRQPDDPEPEPKPSTGALQS